MAMHKTTVVLVAGVIAICHAGPARAGDVDVNVSFQVLDTQKHVKDAGIKIVNGTPKGCSDLGGFGSFKPGTNSFTFDGGDIQSGGAHELTLQVTPTDPTKPVKAKWTKFSSQDNASIPSKKEMRSTSDKDDIFSKAVWGGPSGTSFLGVSIPANQWAYFYQFDRSPDYTATPDHFEMDVGGGSPTAMGYISNTWPVNLLLNDLPQDIAIDGSVTYGIIDHMDAENLSGNAGIAPSQWFYSTGKMTALYTSAFNPGDISDILWFTHPGEPEIGGPLGIDGDNARIFSGGDTVLQFTNGVITPTPEPSVMALLALGSVMLLRGKRKSS